MKAIYVAICCVALFGWISEATAGKKHCKKYLKKLHNIQALQRQGGNLKKTQSLKKRENKARDTWWQCEKGRK